MVTDQEKKEHSNLGLKGKSSPQRAYPLYVGKRKRGISCGGGLGTCEGRGGRELFSLLGGGKKRFAFIQTTGKNEKDRNSRGEGDVALSERILLLLGKKERSELRGGRDRQ